MVPTLGFKARASRTSPSVRRAGVARIVSAIPQVIANLVDGGRLAPEAGRGAAAAHGRAAEVLVSTRVGEAALAGLARARATPSWRKRKSYSTLNFARPLPSASRRRGLEAGVEQFGMAWATGY